MNAYTRRLDAAWQTHLAPRAADAPTVVSTFAGTGGSTLGYSMAGFREVLACEWEENAVESFKLNFPDVPVHHGDISDLTVDDVFARTGLRRGELDVFDGSPPCQGFSTSGKRDFGDDRNQLFRQYVRLLDGLQPKAFVMENVSGMFKGKMKITAVQCLRELKATGYSVAVRLLNAKYFGVPQARERVFFIGMRNDLGIVPSHPAPFTLPLTCREALTDVVNDPAEVAMLMKAGLHYSSYKNWHLLRPGQSYSDIREDKSCFNAVKFDPDRPSPTVRKNDGNLGMHGAMHWADRRRFTVPEFKRLCGFPDPFQFSGSYTDAVMRMGNCVPPLMMRAIAQHIRAAILPAAQEGRAA